MKKILITCTELMMIQFLVPHVKNLAENGFEVEVACSNVGGRMDEVYAALDGAASAVHILRLERSPVSPRNLLGFGDLRRLLKENRYDIIWTNEPVMGVATRLAANKYRRQGTKVVYMCHGFHFYKGAGKANWLLFYPVEKFLSRMCDMIVTINREDEARAKTFHCPRVEYIHGVGMNLDRFRNVEIQSDIRRELGLPEDTYLMLSVGELNDNKNHQTAIRALAKWDAPDTHYLICGIGDRKRQLQQLCRELGMEEKVHFLGYRRDIPSVCSQANVFVFPSFREGLPFALMEAMAGGLPIISSRIRGAVDLIEDGKGGILCDPASVEEFAGALRKIRTMDRQEMAKQNLQMVSRYSLKQTKDAVQRIFNEI